jgi:hypothetical protein
MLLDVIGEGARQAVLALLLPFRAILVLPDHQFAHGGVGEVVRLVAVIEDDAENDEVGDQAGGWMRRTGFTSAPWPIVSGCWAASTRRRWPRVTTSPPLVAGSVVPWSVRR